MLLTPPFGSRDSSMIASHTETAAIAVSIAEAGALESTAEMSLDTSGIVYCTPLCSRTCSIMQCLQLQFG